MQRLPTPRLSRLAPFVILALSMACETQYDPCFGTAQKVKDLRVLAVRSDPPEIVFDPAAALLPEVRVSLLVADPQTTDELTITGALCPQAEDKRCGEGAVAIAALIAKPGAVSFPVRVPRPLLDAALAADPLRGYGGIRVQLDLQIQGSFRRSERATKLLLFTPASPGYVPNHGFEILGLGVTLRGRPAGFVTPKDVLPVAVADLVGLRPILVADPASPTPAEEYDVVDLSGRAAHLREHLSYSLYSTAHGRFLSDTADDPGAYAVPSLDGVFKFQSTLEGNGALYIVARDGRGGVAWFTSAWSAVDLRSSTRKPNLELECE